MLFSDCLCCIFSFEPPRFFLYIYIDICMYIYIFMCWVGLGFCNGFWAGCGLLCGSLPPPCQNNRLFINKQKLKTKKKNTHTINSIRILFLVAADTSFFNRKKNVQNAKFCSSKSNHWTWRWHRIFLSKLRCYHTSDINTFWKIKWNYR